MERQKFEESFREAFQKAEVNPTENVWTNIELDLERLESGKMKRRILFYKLVAAASIAFAMAIGGVGYYILSTDESGINGIAQTNNAVNATPPKTSSSLNDAEQSIVERTEDSGLSEGSQSLHSVTPVIPNLTNEGTSIENFGKTEVSKQHAKGNTSGNNSHANLALESNSGTTLDQTIPIQQELVQESNPSQSERAPDQVEGINNYNRKLPAIVRQRKPVVVFPKTEPDKFDVLLAQEMWREKRQKQSTYEKVWTSVGFSAGSFSGSSSSADVSALSANSSGFSPQSYSLSNTLSNETSASGLAYSVGVNVGTRISKRWILQGGLNYMTQNSNYTSNAVITSDYQNYSAVNSMEIAKLSDASSDARVVPASPYNINSSLQFLSVPLQAGYVLLNRSFAIQLNGGVSTDLFLQNTITPDNGSLDKVSNGRGDDSPYRPVNFSGLVGTEFSYRFADRYRLSLSPGVRYPFSSIYKSETGLQANPVTFDVGLRFRYIFH